MDLPAGLTSRALTLADVTAVHALIAAEEVADLGMSDTTLEDVVSDWRRPSYDVAASTIGVPPPGPPGRRRSAPRCPPAARRTC